jgi:hypothetical protein
MRSTLLILSLIVALAGILAASAQEQPGVMGINAVGYIKKTLPPGGKFVCMSIPLEDMATNVIVFGQTSVAQGAPAGSEAFFWDVDHQSWSGGSKGGKGWSVAVSNQVISVGEGFFLKGAGDAASPVDVAIKGEVPSSATLQRAIPGSSAFGTLANPYPSSFQFGTSSLARDAAVGSEAFFWDVDQQSWSGGSKGGKGWSVAVSNQMVDVAEGFFLKEAGSGKTWQTEKPYTWP